MNKLNDSMWPVVGLASLVVLGGALAVPGCSNDDPVADAGGNGGEGGAGTGGAGTGGAGTGGATASCDAPGLGAGGGGGAAGEEIEIAGSYDDSYGGEVVITTSGIESIGIDIGSIGIYHFSSVDNEGNFAIARNDEANTYNPCMWSRFDWTTDGGDLYYCQSAFDAADEQTAAKVPAGDAEDLETGCGGFAWSKLTSL